MIDKQRITDLHAELNKVLKDFAEANGLSVSPFNVSYSASGFKCGIEFGDKDEIGEADPILAKNLKKFGFWFGLSTDDLNKEFVFGPRKVMLMGMKNRKDVVFKDKADGKSYRAPVEDFAKQNGRYKAVDGLV